MLYYAPASPVDVAFLRDPYAARVIWQNWDATVGVGWPELLQRWRAGWPECPPYAATLKCVYPERWVRFHSLPQSKRYAHSEAEYEIVLERYNTVLSDLFLDGTVVVVTVAFDPIDPRVEQLDNCDAHGLNPSARFLATLLENDPAPLCREVLHASEHRWRPRLIDPLLRAVADDECAGVMIADLERRRIFHPYDGGADVIMESTGERDRIRDLHRNWLSSHPSGL